MKLSSQQCSIQLNTCLSSLSKYLNHNDQNLSQMSKLKHYFDTTITRYKKKSMTCYRSQTNKKQHRYNQSDVGSSWKDDKRKLKCGKMKGLIIDPQLMEVCRVKLQKNQKCQRIKTDYTVPRNNVKSYIKMKKHLQFQAHKSYQSNNNENQRQLLSTYYKKPTPRYQQLTNSTQLEDIIVQLSKKTSKTKTQGCQIDQMFQKKTAKKTVSNRNKVVYSSKVNTRFTRYQNQEPIKICLEGSKSSKNQQMLLTGWDVIDNDEETQSVETKVFKRVKNKSTQ